MQLQDLRTDPRELSLFQKIHEQGPPPKKKKKNWLGPGISYQPAIVLRTVIKKPKKPNSANRK